MAKKGMPTYRGLHGAHNALCEEQVDGKEKAGTEGVSRSSDGGER